MSRAPSAAGPERARVVLSGLSALTHRIASLGDGRKALLFVSEGFAVADAPDRRRLRGTGVDTIVEAAERGGVAIYTIDPRVGTAAPTASGDEAEDPSRRMLRALADQTGGTSVSGDRIDEGLTGALRDLDGYYRVSYRPTDARDGRHAIDVRVSRQDARVRSRAARWASAPVMARTASPASMRSSIAFPRRVQQVSPLIDTWFGTARGPDGRTRVTFTWQPRANARPSPDWLTLTATDTDGRLVFEGRVDPIRAIGSSGPTLSAVFDAPPGLVQIDMTLRDGDGTTLGLDRRDVQLPDLHMGGARLSTPAIIRTHSALQFRTLSADPLAPPTVSRRFDRRERLIVRVHAYAADAQNGRRPDVTARLLGRRQETLLELTALPDAPADDLVQFDLPLSSLRAGTYGIELRVGDRRELVMFDVTN
jgi:hypothetical protein